jgi:hypothetical protein
MKSARATIVQLERPEAPDVPAVAAESSRRRPAAEIAWLIENYDPPDSVLYTSSADSDSNLEAVAAVYQSRPRSETFIEWLWRNYPPRVKER